jgi:hypothetical protein
MREIVRFLCFIVLAAAAIGTLFLFAGEYPYAGVPVLLALLLWGAFGK